MVRSIPLDKDQALSWKHYSILVVIVSFCWLLTVVGLNTISTVTGLYQLAHSQNPYFQTNHITLLYVLMPVVVISSFIVFLSPGLVLCILFSSPKRFIEWVLQSFAISIISTFIISTLIKLLTVAPVTQMTFLVGWGALTLGGLLILGWLIFKGKLISWPIEDRMAIRRIAWTLSIWFIGICLLLPKLFWENFNLDGIEAFEFGRSLANHYLPYWQLQGNVFGFYLNFFLFSIPNHWFITLYGPVEAAVRLPYLFYLGILFLSLIALIELKSPRRLKFIEEALLLLSLILYSIVQVYNTNYEPFFADIAENAATDTLFVVAFISATYFFLSKKWGWFFIIGALAMFASPGSFLPFVALGLAILISGVEEKKEYLQTLAMFLFCYLILSFVYEYAYTRIFLTGVNNQFSIYNMLRRLYPPNFTSFSRLGILIFSCGILPIIAIAKVKRKDLISWALSIIILLYFAIVYIQTWTSVHQFTLIMVLPLIVFWRVTLNTSPKTQSRLWGLLFITILVSLYLSLPAHFRIDLSTREFGQQTEYKIGDYDTDYKSTLLSSCSLDALVPKDYRLLYPNQPWGTDGPAWIYYATRKKQEQGQTNYLIQSENTAAPPAYNLVSSGNGIAVYVKDINLWHLQLESDIPKVSQGKIYQPVLRETYQFFRSYVTSRGITIESKPGQLCQ